MNLIRRFLTWYMAYPPYNPYASLSFSANFQPMRDYLAKLNAAETDGDSGHVTVQHVVVACLARTYAEFPVANAAISRGGQTLRFPQVGVVMPVTLNGASRGETGAVIVEEAQRLSLRELARMTRKRVRSERSNTPDDPVFATLAPTAARIPRWLFNGLLSAGDALFRLGPLETLIRSQFPLTVVVSNVGSSVPMPEGAMIHGAGFTPPRRFISIGSLLGVMPVQNEVVPVAGSPEVRPMLPMTYVFDHRLFDGVKAGVIIARFCQMLSDPESALGNHGLRGGPSHVG